MWFRSASLALALLFALALGRAAWGAPSAVLSLPPGEPASEWTEAASLGGFRLGLESTGDRVQITVDGARWRIHVVDADGVVHDVVVTAPGSSQAREDLVWLARSLLTPVAHGGWATVAAPSLGALSSAPAPGPAPPLSPQPLGPSAPPAEPAAITASPPAPAVDVPPAPVAGVGLPSAVSTPLSLDPAQDASALATRANPAGVSAGVGGLVAYRADIGVAAGLRVDLLGQVGWLRVGGAAGWQPAVALVGLKEERSASELVFGAEVGWQGAGRLRPAVLGGAGLSVRSFMQGKLVVDRVPTPYVGLRAALGWAVRPGIVLEPWAAGTLDLGRVELAVGESRTSVGGQTVRAGLTLFAHFGS